MTVNLGCLKWRIKGFWPYETSSFVTIPDWNESKGITDWIDASVPGSIHHDLLAADLIPDPYVGKNSLLCEWVEKKWWIYRTEFSLDDLMLDDFAYQVCLDDGNHKNGIARIKFSGVDYDCEVFLNGKLLCEHSNLFEPFEVDVTGKLAAYKNFLCVVIKQAPEEEMQLGRTTNTKTQKPRFAYKWDFCSRLVNIGIWDDVTFCVTGKTYIRNIFARPSAGCDGFNVLIEANKSEDTLAKIEIMLSGEICSSKEISLSETESGYLQGAANIKLDNPQLWYPSGEGMQTLYDIKITLYCSKCESDSQTIRCGLRKAEFIANERAASDALAYTLSINGKKTYMKGVNWVPLDHLYGSCREEDYRRAITRIRDMNANIIRVWGGGLIEKDSFYSICDELGIMVWQDFIQSSSGTDYWPCIDEIYLKEMKKTTMAGIKKIRNHPCHVVYTGGNELMYYGSVPVGYDNENIEIIHECIKQFDKDKYFLPSTPSGPVDTIGKGYPLQSHDIHGAWSYMGEDDHYRVYGESDNLLHSEFGVQGMCAVSSAKRFMPEDSLSVISMAESSMWRFHGDWWCCLDRDKRLYGMPHSYENFVCMSQYTQAEGLRFIIDSNRRRAFQNSGSFIWQFNEPYPNISCTSIVDYYGIPKQAYYAARRSYAPLRFSLFYKSLIQKNLKKFCPEIWCFNDSSASQIDLNIKIFDIYGVILYRRTITVKINANSSALIEKMNTDILQLSNNIFFVRLEYGMTKETWMFSRSHELIFRELDIFKRGVLNISNSKDGYLLKNTGADACVGVMLNDSKAMDGGITIFPGEELFISSQKPLNNIKAVWINN